MTLSRSNPRSQQRWSLLTAAIIILSLFAGGSVLATHDLGVFELEGNAVDDTATGDDWANVCHEVTDGAVCATATDTSGATAVAWTAELDRSASIFTGGGSKDPEDISAWAWKDGGGLPDKDNLLHAFAARYTVQTTGADGGCPDSIAPCDILYFGSDRFDNSGDAVQGFWFLQDEVTPSNTKLGGGFAFDGVHTEGDLLVLSDFSNGGSVSTINIYKWVESGGDTSAHLDFLAGSDDAKCANDLADDPYCGIVNEAAGVAAPWPYTDKSGNSTYLAGEFFEAGINLSSPDINLDGRCFASLVSETRSSTSPTATLKDFVVSPFGECEASISTSPKVGTTSGGGQTVTPGTAVVDVATITGVGGSAPPYPTSPPNVVFSMCGPIASGVCDGSDTAHTATQVGTSKALTPTATQGVSSATSDPVNGAGSPLSPGRYCFKADWAGDENYPDDLSHTGTLNSECFTVAKINTGTVTTPGAFNTATPPVFVGDSTIALGDSIIDRAVVTGNAAGGDPTGDVNFYLCKIEAGTCDGTNNVGTAVAGNPKALVSDGDAATFTAIAYSNAVTPTQVGRYCFRAEYLGSTVYNGSSDSATTECFAVSTTSSASSEQKWLPNDSASISSSGPLQGSLTITLYTTANCTGNAVTGQSYTTTLNDTSAPYSGTLNTDNQTYFVTSASVSKTISWKTVFTSTNAYVGSSERCETSTFTNITD